MWCRLKRVTAPSKLPGANSSAVASPTEKTAFARPLALRLAAGELDHRRGHVDAVHLAHPRREPAGDEPGPAGGVEPALAGRGRDQVEQAPERVGRAHRRRGVERLGLVR